MTVFKKFGGLFSGLSASTVALVSSVFGRIGAVIAVAGDYLASQITNDSTVPGSFVDDALDNLLNLISTSVKDTLTIALDGDTVFALSVVPQSAPGFDLYLNGVRQERGVDFTQAAQVLTWLDPAGLTLKTTDVLIARYNTL